MASLAAYTTRNLTKVYGEGRSAVHALRGVALGISGGRDRRAAGAIRLW